jgi:hypothetical protein
LIFLGTLILGGRVRTSRRAGIAAAGRGGRLRDRCLGRPGAVTTRSEWLWAALLTALNLLVLAHAALALSPRRLAWMGVQWLERRAGWLVATAGFAAAVMMLALVFDPRYRSFPARVHAAGTGLPVPPGVPRREIALLTFIIGAGIAPQLFREGLQNQQAWGWALVSVLMVAALWRCLRVRKADLLAGPRGPLHAIFSLQ